MKITIQGTEYAAALDFAEPLTVERRLNEPSLCAFCLSLERDGVLPVPARGQRVVIRGDDERLYFTGYIASAPFPLYAGMAVEGPRYRYRVEAVSDEVLLNQLMMPSRLGTAVQTAGSLLSSLVAASGSTAVSASALNAGSVVGYYAAGGNWSASAGAAARMARSCYRVVNGALTLTVAQSVVHTLDETEGTLNLNHLVLGASSRRAMANDVTVCGRTEPVAYVTEFFTADGATTQFALGAAPYLASSSSTVLIRELFNQMSIDERVWSNATTNQSIHLGGGGLVMDGGNGMDGQTVLSWRTPVEMAGTLLMEAEGVALSPGSTGVVCGFFNGLLTQSTCVCGFQVNAAQGTGAVSVHPLVSGEQAGTPYEILPTAQYKLRIRVHSPETVRATALYHSFGDSGPIAAGGDLNLSAGLLQMEIQPFVNGVGGMPVTLYEGSLAYLPVTCTAVPCSSLNLIGSMRGFYLSSQGSVWVSSTPLGGGERVRRTGTLAQAAECSVDSAGKLVFNTGFTPEAGELIRVRYRSRGRAVGRAVNAESQQALERNGLPGQVVWAGTVTEPAARCSADCRNAATVLAQAASSQSAQWSGRYDGLRAEFAEDVWPGDALQLTAPSLTLETQVVVRTVKISYRASVPDLVRYEIAFANDWAADLAIATSESVPSDVWLPAPVEPVVLGNLTALTVTAVTGSTVTVNTGVAAPEGGGFEVRRRDFAFMPGEDADLVMRASVPNLTFARAAFNDQFFVRMFDGATPPNYSEFSAAVFINLPLDA